MRFGMPFASVKSGLLSYQYFNQRLHLSKEKNMAEKQTPSGNPAVVGLAGFGLTTLILQLHNLGLCGLGPVIACGLIFGGLAQLIAGFQEFKFGHQV